MQLEFNKTYSNVRFQKWGKFFSCEFYVDEFITDIKKENPEMIIVSDQRERCGDGHYATIIGMTTDNNIDNNTDNNNNDNFGGQFIDEFFEKEYPELDELLSLKSLKHFYDLHKQHNDVWLLNIRSMYNDFKDEYYEYKVGDFNSLNYKFDIVESFNIISSDTDGLSSTSLNRLIKYNYIIQTFKQKFYDIKDEMRNKLESYKKENGKFIRE